MTTNEHVTSPFSYINKTFHEGVLESKGQQEQRVWCENVHLTGQTAWRQAERQSEEMSRARSVGCRESVVSSQKIVWILGCFFLEICDREWTFL